jgi:ankyrin repeat protein
VLLLLQHGASIDKARSDGASPLSIACQGGHTDTVRMLLLHGASVNMPTVDGATPLYVSCWNGHQDATRLLLQHGATVDSAIDGASPFAPRDSNPQYPDPAQPSDQEIMSSHPAAGCT